MRIRQAAAAVAAGFLACLVVSVPAQADDGVLVINPPKGSLGTPMDVVTSGLCTRGVTFVVAVRGKGIDPATAGNLVGNTPLASTDRETYPGHYFVPLSYTWIQYFTNNGMAPPKGEFEVVFSCRNRLDAEDLQTFTAKVSLTARGYTALGDAATPVDEFTASSAPASPSDPANEPSPQTSGGDSSSQSTEASTLPQDSTSPQDSASPQNSASKSADSGMGASDVTSQPPSDLAASPVDSGDAATDGSQHTAVASQTTSDSSWRTLLIVVGLILILGAVYALWRQRKGA